MKSAKKWDVIGMGAIAVDDLLFVPHFPNPDSKIQVTRRERYGGGLTGTALVAASRLGAKAAYFGKLGNNDLSEFTLQEFSREGVDTTLCPRDNSSLPIHSTIIVDETTGERTILYCLKNFTSPEIELISDNLPCDCQLLFIDTFFLGIMRHMVKISHAVGTPVIADIESPKMADDPQTLAEIDYLILSKSLAAQITKVDLPQEILGNLNTHHRKCTVITDGANGCWFQYASEAVFHMPAFKVNVLDTTGCGDVFHGAFTAAITRDESIQTAVIQASAAAAIKATRPGGRAGIPELPDLLSFIRTNSTFFPVRIT